MKAWAEVGTHGKIIFLAVAPIHPQCEGKLAIFVNESDARREAGDNIREVTITVHKKKKP